MRVATATQTEEAFPPIRFITQSYARLVLKAFALVPAYLIGYLYFFQDRTLRFENHTFHEIAIAVATLEGLFVTYVTWQCYRCSGGPLLRWMMPGFFGFVLIYALHGAFTGLAHHDIWLFLAYGPASRLARSILLLVALLSYRQPADPVDRRVVTRYWLTWTTAFLVRRHTGRTSGDFDVCWHCSTAAHGERGAYSLGAECRRPDVTPDPFPADVDLRHLGDVVCAVVACIPSGNPVEPQVVAGTWLSIPAQQFLALFHQDVSQYAGAA